MQTSHATPRFAGATDQPCAGSTSRGSASGPGADIQLVSIPTPHHCGSGRCWRPVSSPSMRLRHFGNSSVRCGVQYAKPASWRSAGVAEEGASDPVVHVGDRVGVRRGYLGSSILPGAIVSRVEHRSHPRGTQPWSKPVASPRACGPVGAEGYRPHKARDMSLDDPTNRIPDDSTDPGAPERRVPEGIKQLRIALGDLRVGTTQERLAAQELEACLERARNADELLNGGSE